MSTKGIAILAFVLIVGMASLTSCSQHGTDRISPLEPNIHQAADETLLGVYKIIPGEDLNTAEIVRVRTAQLNVTQYADISVLSAVWDPVLRTWTLTVKLTNPTQYTGWGVRAVFTELGQKELRWPDGFIWKLTGGSTYERLPFFAIEKDTMNRAFPGLHTSTRDITFHFPQGINNWLPIAFYLDARVVGPRPDPMVEDLATAHFPPPCQHGSVIAKVQDHQSDSADLTVWIDLSPMGGPENEPMYDDGEHEDAEVNDGIFGVEFLLGTVGQLYTLTVYATDPENNSMENDVWYSPMGYPPLPPIEFEELMTGNDCLLVEERLEVIGNQADWEQFWLDFSPWDMSAPEIPFDTQMVVAVCTGQRPDDCYSVMVDGIVWSGLNCGWAVNYTETVPGPNCICNDIVTSPYSLVTVNKASFNVIFQKDIYIDPCSDVQLAPIPIANVIPNPQTVCADINFTDGGSYDPDGGSIIEYEWDWDNDGNWDESGEDVWHSWDTPGTYLVNFRVTDDEMESSELDDPLEVVIENALPVIGAAADKYSAYMDEEITFDASGSYDGDCGGNSISLFEWDFDFDGTFIADDFGDIVSHSYSEEGTYGVQCRITDDEGETVLLSSPLSITVEGSNPCLDIDLLLHGAFGLSFMQKIDLITNQATLDAWFQSAVGSGPAPLVDFEVYMVVAVAMGAKSSSGYYPTVDSACEVPSGQLEIIVTMHEPGPDCIILPVFTYPYGIYLVEKSEIPHYFTVLTDIYSCD